MKVFTEENPSVRARVHLVFLKGTYLVETNTWDDEIAETPVDIRDLNISIRSQYYFLEGMKAYVTEDVTKLESVLKRIENDIDRESFVLDNGSASVCSNVKEVEIISVKIPASIK